MHTATINTWNHSLLGVGGALARAYYDYAIVRQKPEDHEHILSSHELKVS